MKRFWRWIIVIALILSVFSFIPVIFLYISKSPALYSNQQAFEKIKDAKGDYFGFIVLGDNHSGLVIDDSATLKIVQNINREERFTAGTTKKLPIDFVIIVGDVSFRGSKWDYGIFNKIRAKIRWPVVCAAGNHDDDKKESWQTFHKYVGKKEFAFAHKNAYFIVLNNTVGDITEKQYEWFEAQLKQSQPYTNRFVIMHKSPVSHYMQSWYRPELSPWSNRIKKLCEQYKVGIVFSGHEHMYGTQAFHGVEYVASGGGGVIPIVPRDAGGFLHYLVVRVNGSCVDYEVRKIFPPFWEFITYYLWKDIFFFIKDIFV